MLHVEVWCIWVKKRKNHSNGNICRFYADLFVFFFILKRVCIFYYFNEIIIKLNLALSWNYLQETINDEYTIVEKFKKILQIIVNEK